MRKEKTDRSWRTESERKSLIVDSRGRGDAGEACVDVGWTVLSALADAAGDELDGCRGGRRNESENESVDDSVGRWELRGARPTPAVAIARPPETPIIAFFPILLAVAVVLHVVCGDLT